MRSIFAGEKTLAWPRVWLGIAAGAAIVYLGVVGFGSVVAAMSNAVDFSGYGVNGAFQLYNPLRRLSAGQVIGQDFQFFHGPGVVLLHYPLFALLGENIFASEIARWLISPLAFVGSGFILMLAFLKDWRRAVIALAIATALIMPFDKMIEPSNSLMGLRTTFPLLVAAAMVSKPSTQWQWRGLRADPALVAAIVLLGFAVLFGTEQGAAASGAFLLVRLVQNLRASGLSLQFLTQTALETAAVFLSIFLIFTIFTLGNAIPALEYAFVEVPRDQGWVFGSPPNAYMTPASLFWDLVGGYHYQLDAVPRYWIFGLISAGLVIIAMKYRLLKPQFLWGALFLYIYGLAVLVSLIGYQNLIDQMAPFARAAVFVGSAALTALCFSPRPWRSTFGKRAQLRKEHSQYMLAGPSALAIVVLLAWSAEGQATEALSVDFDTVAEKVWKGPGQTDSEIAGEGWRNSIATLEPRFDIDSTIWGTYTSLYESNHGQLGLAAGGEDYIIHALGPDRRAAYTASFLEVNPDFVVTTDPRYSNYEEWLWQRWPLFYKEVLRNYEIVDSTGSHYLWAPRVEPTPRVFFDSARDEGGRFTLPPNDTGSTVLYEVRLSYSIEPGWLGAPSLPRYLVFAENAALRYPISLPSYESEWTMIVPVLPGQSDTVLRPATGGIVHNAELSILRASYSPITTSASTNELFEFNYCTLNPFSPAPSQPVCAPFINR